MNPRDEKALLEELADDKQPIIELAIAYVEHQLSDEGAEAFRERMRTDDMFRRVAQGILDAWEAPPLPEAEVQRYWQDFRRRVGLATPQTDSDLFDPGAEVSTRVRPLRPLRSSWWRVAARIAAVLVIAIGGVMGFTAYLRYTSWVERGTPSNATVALQLPDNSVVRLGASSRIKFLRHMIDGGGRRRRDVYLSGEATFQVAATGRANFQVITVNARLIAAGESKGGTTFTVVDRAGVTDVLVHTGRVTVQALDTGGNPAGPGTQLTAGGSARVTGGTVLTRGVTPASSREERK